MAAKAKRVDLVHTGIPDDRVTYALSISKREWCRFWRQVNHKRNHCCNPHDMVTRELGRRIKQVFGR